MKRLLCMVSAMNAGGAETFLMKIYRNLDKTKYQMDFCVNSSTNLYEKEIVDLGGRIYVVPPKSESVIGWYKETKKIVRENQYHYVLRVCEHSLAALDLIVAKQGGADHLIMRSSNASSGSKVSVLLHKMFKFLAISIPTAKIAPSTEAAEYTFGKGCVSRGDVLILHNAIDTDIFHFDSEGRKRIREELNLEGKYVVGHVGRFNKQKNHEFLIDVFSELLKKKPESRLVLVGAGELEEQIRQKVCSLDLEPYVVFTGVRKDVPQLLSAFDVFLFPSLYEGMPNTVIEAQATGLPCVVSDTITREANISGNVFYYSLNKSAEEWAEKSLEYLQKRQSDNSFIYKAGYDIKNVVHEFERIIFY